jgi:hypothetical protein
MSLDIGAAIRDGASRLTTRSGALLFVAFLVVGVLSAVATQSLNVALFESLVELAESGPGSDAADPAQVDALREQLRGAREGSPLAVGIPAGAAAALALLLGLVAEAVTLVAVRVFVADRTAELSGALVRRNLGWATLNGFLGGIVVAVVVAIGLVFLLLPGVFLYVSFLFLRQEIAVEDENFIDALVGSWRLSKGNRFELFGLAVIVVLVSLVAFVPGLVLAGFAPLVGTAVGLVVSPVVTLFGVAVVSRAYAQLKADAAAPDEGADETEEDEYAGALGPDDIPEP